MDPVQTTAPQIDLTTEGSENNKGGSWIAGIGVALFSGPIWGMGVTVVGMIRAFNSLAENEAASPEALSQDIRIALVSTMIGLLVGIVGSALIFVAFFVFKNREKWFFWWSVGIAAFQCPNGFTLCIPWQALKDRLKSGVFGSSLTTDIPIVALAMEYGMVVCSNDTNFARFPKIKTIDPLVPR